VGIEPLWPSHSPRRCAVFVISVNAADPLKSEFLTEPNGGLVFDPDVRLACGSFGVQLGADSTDVFGS
jgi:hypothetical protein